LVAGQGPVLPEWAERSGWQYDFHSQTLTVKGPAEGGFGYALRDWDSLNDFRDQDFYLNKTNLNHEYKYHYGKKIIEVELYENTKLCGEIINDSTSSLLHNFKQE
jgi:hypothetical protein